MKHPPGAADPAARISAAYLCLLLAFWVLEAFAGAGSWLVDALTYAPQHPWALGALALLGFAAARRSGPGLLLAASALVVAMTVLMGLCLGDRSAAPPRGEVLRLLTLNADHADATSGELWRRLAALDLDVVCLQEVNSGDDRRPPPGWLRRAMPGYEIARSGQLATLSRRPILAQRVRQLGESTGRTALAVRLQVGSQQLEVLNTHFLRPRSDTARPWFALEDPRRSGRLRALQMESLLAFADELDPPVVVAGDLNTPPRGRPYRRLAGRYEDLFCRCGRGFGHTFPAPWPLWRIDYVFTSRGIESLAVERLSEMGSDHLGVLATLLVVPVSARSRDG